MNVWEFLRANRLPFQIYETQNEIIQRCCDAWNRLTCQPQRISAIGLRLSATVMPQAKPY
ncbi:hypothetical protein GCM10011320_51620 [Neoroseomonas lacus]|uniref:Transposase n=1 Tax=Neoroseomonas lacus TaxID=287609 RepID=A0A917L130_9PROT|nr:hypothetical protein GCM10011320_51620 [Neoroseomonas lacus]